MTADTAAREHNGESRRVEFSIDLNAMALRFLYLQSHYRRPLDYSDARFRAAKKALRRLLMAATPTMDDPPSEIVLAVADDLNTPKALAVMAKYRAQGEGKKLFAALRFLGFTGDGVEVAGESR